MNQFFDLRGWKSYLLWEGLPFLLPLFVFGLFSALNWDYESKLISLDQNASDWTGVYLGPILLASATGAAAAASLILLTVRIILRVAQPKSGGAWYMLFSLIVVSIFFIFPSLFIIVLAPASITMIEQMRVTPN